MQVTYEGLMIIGLPATKAGPSLNEAILTVN